MTIAAQRPRLRVAIVGAGPGGLAATIFLGRLDFVDLAVYDQATILREIGAVRFTLEQRLHRESALIKTPGVFSSYSEPQSRLNSIPNELMDESTASIGMVIPPRSSL